MAAQRKFRVSVNRGALTLERECAESEMADTAQALLEMMRCLARENPELREYHHVEHVGAAHQFDSYDGLDEGRRRRTGFVG